METVMEDSQSPAPTLLQSAMDFTEEDGSIQFV
jgi:hypothetical protein